MNWENVLTNLCRSLDAATPIRFTISSCNRQQYYARSHGAKQPWRSHYNTICRERVAKHKNLMARTSQIAAELQSTQELRTTAAEIAAPKPDGSRRQRKKTILKHFLKGVLEQNHQRQNWENLRTNHYCSLDAATPIRFTMSSCKKTIVLCTQPRSQATLTQPLQCDLPSLSCKAQKNYAQERWQNDAWTVSSTAGPIREWSRYSRDRPGPARRTRFPIHLPGHVLSCETQQFVHLLTLSNAFRARLPSKSKSGRCENEAFVRDFPPKVKWKMWKRSFSARLPSESESWRCENKAFGDVVIAVILWWWWCCDNGGIVIVVMLC